MIIYPVHNKDNSIIIGVSEEKKLPYPFHYHLEHYELTYIEGGIGILLIGNKTMEFTGRDLLLIPPRIPHTWISYKNRDLSSETNYRYITIQFQLKFLTEELMLRPEMSNIRRLLVAAEQVAILRNIRDPAIIKNLFNLKLEPDFSTYIQVLELMNRLGSNRELGQVLENNYTYRGNKKDKESFEKVFVYILDHYNKRVKISVPAGILELNDTAFSHYFKKRTGKSFTDYINLLRLLEADALIRHTGKKIARISTECGFNNLSNFNRIYKNWQKASPAERRKSHDTSPS